MKQIRILIVDENPDFVKSLSKLIIDVFGEKVTSFDFTFNIQDGLELIGKDTFHFAFLRVSICAENTGETKMLFKKTSLNPFVKVIALSFQNESVPIYKGGNFEKLNYYNKEAIDVDEFVLTLEAMK